MIVAFVGPDGAGKSSIIAELTSALSGDFPLITVRHWRPGLLPPLRRLAGYPTHMKRPITQMPRRQPGRMSALRLLYYWLDFALGHFVRDRPLVARGGLVLYDRCALDVMVDPSRYGLASTRWQRPLWRCLPRPDLTVLVDDNPESIAERKSELPASEIARQLGQWRELHNVGAVNIRLPASGNVQHRASVITRLIRDRIRGRHDDDTCTHNIAREC